MGTRNNRSPIERAVNDLEHDAVCQLQAIRQRPITSADNATDGYWNGKVIAFAQVRSILADLYATEPLADVLATLDK